jgi:hypothetical protein
VIVASADARGTGTRATSPATCGVPIKRDAPAAWARFGAPPTGTPYIAADSRLDGFLFTQKLRTGNRTNPHNKILWILNDGSPTQVLSLTARRVGTGAVAHRQFRAVDRAGRIYPSYVNLPAAGCWTLNFTWNGHTTSTAVRVSG